jgi:hypothetical protein
LIHSDVTRVVLEACYPVHTELGYAFLEAIYKNAIALIWFSNFAVLAV